MAKAYNKQPLGRGLSALLDNPSADIKSVEDKNADKIIGNVIDLPIDQINLNPFQPRTNFENEKIIELAQSIKQLGIIQPITVRKVGFKAFEIISGERRFRAVSSLKQVVLLCPTTVLSDQHYITAKERLEPLGVSVALLSRFQTKKNSFWF